MNKKALLVSLALVFLLFSACQSTGGPGRGGDDDQASKALKKTFVNSLGMEFVYIEPGTFIMGSDPDEEGRTAAETEHEVTLTDGFYLQTTEVTQKQWKEVMRSFPSRFFNCGMDCPVENITWGETQEFIKKLNELENTDRYRLPREAQWEYACRAGSSKAFNTGNCLSGRRANFDGKYPLKDCDTELSRKKTIPVKSFKPNRWGLYDMHGNVAEATQDWYSVYPEDPVTNPRGPLVGMYRIYRGGSWNNDAKKCRSAARGRYQPEKRSSMRGFRVLALPEEKPEAATPEPENSDQETEMQ